MNILLAGGAGFIGSHLIPALQGAGHKVTALLRPGSAVPEAWTGVEVVRADLAVLDPAALPQAEMLIHLAQGTGAFPGKADDLLAVNCVSAVTMAGHGSRTGASRMIYASSGSVYGFSGQPVGEDSPLLGTGFYSQTKIAAEKLLGEFRDRLQVDLLRIFTPYGPGQHPSRLIPDVVARVRAGRAVSVRANGMPFLSPVAVSDVVACLMARLAAEDSLTLNVAGRGVTGIREIAECAARITGGTPVFEENTAPLSGGMAGSSALMEKATGVRPVSLEEGLRALCNIN